MVEDSETPAPPRVFAGAWYGLRSALGRPPLWLLCALAAVFPALVVAQPWYRGYADAIQHRYAPGALVATLDEPFLVDHAKSLTHLNAATAELGAVLAFLVMLAYAFAAGGWLQVFLERTEGQSVRRFFSGGSRYFWRFFRVLLVTLPLLHLAGWLLYGKPWTWLVQELLLGDSDGSLENLDSETAAAWVGWIQSGLYAALFATIIAFGIYTRTRLALLGTSSAVFAACGTLLLLVRKPVATLGPLFVLLLAEQLGLFVLGTVSSSIERGLGAESSSGSVWALIALTVLALLWRTLILGAGYAVAVRTSRALVPPLARPDPWKARAGGPGGPQYPIGADEYEVAV